MIGVRGVGASRAYSLYLQRTCMSFRFACLFGIRVNTVRYMTAMYADGSQVWTSNWLTGLLTVQLLVNPSDDQEAGCHHTNFLLDIQLGQTAAELPAALAAGCLNFIAYCVPESAVHESADICCKNKQTVQAVGVDVSPVVVRPQSSCSQILVPQHVVYPAWCAPFIFCFQAAKVLHCLAVW